jgi:hypothetical protein
MESVPKPPQKIERVLTQEEMERENAEGLEIHFELHPEQLTPPATLREAGPEIVEFEMLVASFELKHSLTELHAIVDLTPQLAEFFKYSYDMSLTEEELNHTTRHHTEEAAKTYKAKVVVVRAAGLSPEDEKIYNTRMTAKSDLVPIVALLGILEKETNTAKPKLDELKTKYKKLAQAVGTADIKNKKVDHTR